MPSGSAAPGRDEYNEYVEFFDILGITDAVKVAYLSTLLRLFYEAATKLDTHLAPHGACLHSALSRIITSTSPNEPPRHRWIRVVDRLGFFTDKDLHAQRIVNVGLSFAYRKLQLNALTEDNALLLQVYGSERRTAPPTGRVHGGDEVPAGGVEVVRRDLVALPCASSAAGDGGERRRAAQDPLLGNGVAVGSTDEVPSAGGVVVRGASVGPPATTGVVAPVGAGSQGTSGDGSHAVIPGGLVVIDRSLPPQSVAAGGGALSAVASVADEALDGTGAQGGRTFFGGLGSASVGADVISGPRPPDGDQAAGGDLEGQDPSESAGDDNGGGHSDAQADGGNPMKDFENQPTVAPLPDAIGFVLAAMRSIKEVDDATAVMRSLLNDSLLTTARAWRARRPLKSGDARKRTEWTDVFDMMSPWWPVWNAPVDAPAGMPPDGTFAAKDNATRACRSSRWRVRVEMRGVNEMLKKLSTRSYRYFPKNALSSHELVGRYSASTKLRLPATAAMMLLVSTKDENFGPILGNLASGGRPTMPRSSPLATATYHDFAAANPGTTDTTLEGPPATPAAPPSSQPRPVTVHPRAPSAVLDLAGPVARFRDQLFDDMDATLDQERVGEGVQNRAARLAHRRASGRPPRPRDSSQVPDAGSSSAAPGGTPAAPSSAGAGRGSSKRKLAAPGRSPPPAKRRPAVAVRGGRGGVSLARGRGRDRQPVSHHELGGGAPVAGAGRGAAAPPTRGRVRDGAPAADGELSGDVRMPADGHCGGATGLAYAPVGLVDNGGDATVAKDVSGGGGGVGRGREGSATVDCAAAPVAPERGDGATAAAVPQGSGESADGGGR